MKYYSLLSLLFIISLKAMDQNGQNCGDNALACEKIKQTSLHEIYKQSIQNAKESHKTFSYNKDGYSTISNTDSNNNSNLKDVTASPTNVLKAATINIAKKTRSLSFRNKPNSSKEKPTLKSTNGKKITTENEALKKVQKELKNKFGNK